MKALVVGGNGFIGSHLVDGLLKNGWDVSILDLHERRYGPIPTSAHFIRGDLTQSFLVREAVQDVDIVFHLAWATIHEVANQDPAADIHTNLIPSIHLFEACRQANVQRIIFTSSGGTVYGPAQKLPISEAHPNNPINAYGITKLAVEKYLHMFHHLYGLDYAIFRPSVPYGPRQNPLGRQGAVAVFLYRVAQELPITIWGDGSVSRDFFFVSDLIDALIVGATHNLKDQRVFNIGGAEAISLTKLVEEVEKTVNKQAQVEYLASRQFDAQHIFLETQLAEQILNWQPQVLLTEGLVKAWEWMSTAIISKP